MIKFLSLVALCFFLTFANCGGSGGTTGDDDDDDIDNTVNTEKLIGTPFEGMTRGDDINWDFFRCGQYRTETIDSFPVEIFTAFFTTSEETTIQEGIDIANEAMGEEIYVLTNEWRDDLRVIYKVNEIAGDDIGGGGAGLALYRRYNFEDKQYAAQLPTDWVIEVTNSGVNKWVVAHELGHASGLQHMKIDYENDELVTLEENSIMQASFPSTEPALGDYNYMMQMQKQIMEDHFGEMGQLELEPCSDA